AGMMDCKKALMENDGDSEKAIEFLRKKGQKVALKRAEREANEGIVLAKTNSDGTFVVNVMVNCETDFVAKNEEFRDFVINIIDKALDKRPASLEEFRSMDFNGRTVDENLTDLIGKIGEKLQVAHYEFFEAPKVFAYNHHGNRLATTVGLSKADVKNIDDIGHEIAMQIAAMNPVAIDKDMVDAKIVEQEIEIGKDLARQEGKPENLVEKIALGKLNKFYKENTLLNQNFVRDTSKTIRQYMTENDSELTVTAFNRLMLGE
ncbi:MAG: elongation factor Ts, partial [Bacteroidales bacterium]|nr:elongation factor Ts [Bacteroidales bacterium]